MKNYFYAATLAVSLAAAMPAIAAEGGSCHFHGSKLTTEAIVTACANGRRDALVSSGKLDKAWQTVKHEKIEIVDGKKGKEWKVTFKDPTAKDAAKQSLYLFFTPPGNFIAANFTGQ